MKSGVYVIAEMSANHAGKIENAFKIIEEAAKAGADCVKIQTYTADTLTIDCDDEPYRIKGGLWDGYNYYQLYQEAYTPWEWQQQLKDKCEEAGVDFLSTPFDRTAVDFLEGIGIEFYKIASFELVDIPLIEYTAGKGKPMIMSCGMASEEEIAEALAACRRQGNEQVILLKCCSQYPAQYEDMNVSVIPDMKERFGAMPTGSQIIVIDGANYTVVSHYTGKKDVDRVIREIAEKQALADMSDPVKKEEKIPA